MVTLPRINSMLFPSQFYLQETKNFIEFYRINFQFPLQLYGNWRSRPWGPSHGFDHSSDEGWGTVSCRCVVWYSKPSTGQVEAQQIFSQILTCIHAINSQVPSDLKECLKLSVISLFFPTKKWHSSKNRFGRKFPASFISHTGGYSMGNKAEFSQHNFCTFRNLYTQLNTHGNWTLPLPKK